MRRAITTLGLLAVLLGTQTADAGWREFWHRVHLDFHRNNAYPEPFLSADKCAIRKAMAVQVHHGWRVQNTIPDQMFNAETNEVTNAGRLLIGEIVTQYPVNRRTVYIVRGVNEEATAARLASVQKAVVDARPVGHVPPVIVTHLVPRGGQGAYYHSINMSYEGSIPAPRLPASTGGGGTTN